MFLSLTECKAPKNECRIACETGMVLIAYLYDRQLMLVAVSVYMQLCLSQPTLSTFPVGGNPEKTHDFRAER